MVGALYGWYGTVGGMTGPVFRWTTCAKNAFEPGTALVATSGFEKLLTEPSILALMTPRGNTALVAAPNC